MDKYSVKLMSQALRDLDGIYDYIAHTLLEPGTALSLVERIEEAILSLETMPYRCPERKRGAYVFRWVLKAAAEEGYLGMEAVLWTEPTLKQKPI